MTKFKHIKPATNYTTEEIKEILNQASNNYEYDYIIDKLYFLNEDNSTHRKNRTKYSILTVKDMKKRKAKEVLTDKDTDFIY